MIRKEEKKERRREASEYDRLSYTYPAADG